LQDDNGDLIMKLYDYPAIVSEHLVDGEKAYFHEVYYDGIWFVNGKAQVINSKGGRRLVFTDDILKLGEEL
jgi:hypothetical protein